MGQSASARRRRIGIPLTKTLETGLPRNSALSSRSKGALWTSMSAPGRQTNRRPMMCGWSVRTNTAIRQSGMPQPTRRSHSSASISCACIFERAPSTSQSTIGLMSLLAILRQRFEMADRPARRERRRRRDDGIGVDAVVPVKLRDRAGLPEMLDAERADAMAVDGAEPGERRRMAVEHGDDPAMGRHIGHELFDM